MGVTQIVTEGYRGTFPTILVSAAGGLLAGVILGGMDAQLKAVQGLLVMVPAFLAIRGSVYGSLGSRLSSALHQGILEPRIARDNRLVAAVSAAVLNGLLATLFAATAAYTILTVLGQPVASLVTLLAIGLIAGLLSAVALTSVILVVVFTGYQRGFNPDNLIGPALTTAGDIFGMLSLYLATELVLVVR
ncbi:magnesium transporter [Halorussus sp. AFM4]|uniref:magnesium transporter n=1 Tax=Halorussus sp. AFM4 TaxID=3421651 RepID=UPI003EBE02A3